MSSPEEIYWPPGWSRSHFVNAEQSEFLALSNEESKRMFASLRSVLGESGLKDLIDESNANHCARVDAAAAAAPGANEDYKRWLTPEMLVPFLQVLREMGLAEQGEWGWVAFRTVALGAEDEVEFLRRFDTVIAGEFDAAIAAQFGVFATQSETFAAQGGIEKVRDAQSRYRVRWITEPDLMGVGEEDVASRYRQIVEGDRQGISHGMLHNACLMVDAACVRSLMEAQIPSPRKWDEMRTVPYVRILSSHIGVEGYRDTLVDGERNSFNVAVLSLVNDLFVTIGGDIQALGEVGVSVSEGKIWCHSGRSGIFTPGKGFSSERGMEAHRLTPTVLEPTV